MKHKIAKLCLGKLDESRLCTSFIDAFEQGNLTIWSFSKDTIFDKFGTDVPTFSKNFVKDWDPHVEEIFFNVFTGDIVYVILSMFDQTNRETYAALKISEISNRYILLFLNRNRNAISVPFEKDDDCFDIDFENTKKLSIKPYFSLPQLGSIVEGHTCNGFNYLLEPYLDYFKKTVRLRMIDKNPRYLFAFNDFDLLDITFDLKDLSNPLFTHLTFEVEEKVYRLCILDGSLEDWKAPEAFNQDGKDDFFAQIIISKALKRFQSNQRSDELDELQKAHIIEGFLSILGFPYEEKNQEFLFPQFEPFPLMFVHGENILLKKRRVSEECECFTYTKQFLIENYLSVLSDFVGVFSSPSSREIAFKLIADKFFAQGLGLKEKLRYYEELQKLKDTLTGEDIKVFRDYDFLLKRIQNEKETLDHIDVAKINEIKALVDRFIAGDFSSEQERVIAQERFFDLRDFGLTEIERNEVKDDLSSMMELLNGETLALEEVTNFRNVFISKYAFTKYKGLPKDVKDAVDEIVGKMKTLPGKDLVFYLNDLQLNHPHGVHKIRIKNKQGYRLCFWRGKDLPEREFNKEAIYVIEFVDTPSKHDDIIQRLVKEKPANYHENEFIVFPLEQEDKQKKNTLRLKATLPECSPTQYGVSSLTQGPVVVYGCAGSGKTIVSIEQYARIAWHKFNSLEPSPSDLAYVTFQEILTGQARRQLETYAIKGNCFSLREFFCYVANCQTGEKPSKDGGDITLVSDKSTFTKWFNQYYTGAELNKYGRKNEIKPLEEKTDLPQLIYTYYRGVFKGNTSLLNAGANTLAKKDDFFEAMSDEITLTDEEKESIFEVCEDYYKYATSNRLLDDNDLALLAYSALKNNHGRKVKNIIIDEIQDLTTLQIHVMVASLREGSRNIFFYGDPHQTINPTIFNDSSISDAIHTQLGPNVKLIENNELKYTYRTNRELKIYLKTLEKKRKDWLHLRMEHLAALETKDDDSVVETFWASYITSREIANDAIKIAVSSSDTVVIVPDEATKQEAIKKFNVRDNKERILTIFEAKGIEWKTVVLYHMLKSNESYFLDMIEGRGVRSTIHRMCFNKYYVSCTRSLSTFVVIEDGTNPLVLSKVLTGLAFISEKPQVELYLSVESTFDGWVEEGLKLKNAGQLDAARNAFLNAGKIPGINAKQRNEIAMYLRVGGGDSNEDECFALGLSLFIQEENYSGARYYFQAAKKGDYYTLMNLFMEEQIPEVRYLESLIASGLLDQYPSAYAKLPGQKVFLRMMTNTFKQIKGEK